MAVLTIGCRPAGMGRHTNRWAFAAIPGLAHLEMGLARVVEESEETAPEYVK